MPDPAMPDPAMPDPAMPDPLTATDLDQVLRQAVATLREATEATEADRDDWDARAGSLEWTCWETVEHLADDLFSYAAQLGPPPDREVPFVWAARRSGGPANVVFADRAAGPAGLLQVLEASGALLVAKLCDRVLARLFPGAPTDPDRWRTLLWATGRAELPEHPRSPG
ncbi:hypothetical protein ACTXG6_01835 [Pseudonocardia sp. Cha107L01]|uniref:hypothetical protein n=1 Tax=Pseudonocardia sp. Cha107L01 TaxID=3457576 RepID=UPI00403E866D